jgi:hypothetical protein
MMKTDRNTLPTNAARPAAHSAGHERTTPARTSVSLFSPFPSCKNLYKHPRTGSDAYRRVRSVTDAFFTSGVSPSAIPSFRYPASSLQNSTTPSVHHPHHAYAHSHCIRPNPSQSHDFFPHCSQPHLAPAPIGHFPPFRLQNPFQKLDVFARARTPTNGQSDFCVFRGRSLSLLSLLPSVKSLSKLDVFARKGAGVQIGRLCIGHFPPFRLQNPFQKTRRFRTRTNTHERAIRLLRIRRSLSLLPLLPSVRSLSKLDVFARKGAGVQIGRLCIKRLQPSKSHAVQFSNSKLRS